MTAKPENPRSEVPGVEWEKAIPPVQRIETVRQVEFWDEPAEPMWRVEVSGRCVDFETETRANYFRDAILALIRAARVKELVSG